MDHLDLVPILGPRPAAHLGPPETADRGAKLGQGQFAAQILRGDIVEFLGAMDGKAEARSPSSRA